ncbi:MAG: hypothetical protein KAG96_00990 [Ichthyobacteriaceae bacterium]|nr:hypothetical protein [Ichthyobacteriaceae bacterium]
MKKIKENIKETTQKLKRLKVRLDYKTFITIKDISSLKIWKDRYPNAKVVGEIYI